MMRITLLLLLLALGACAGRPATVPQESASGEAPEYQNPAVVTLLEEAERQQAAGRLDLASSALERAIRISPRDPVLRVRLGWLRIEQNDPFQAKALARMAVVYARDAEVQAQAWEVVAAAERAIGNQVEATLAEQEAARLRD